MSESLLEAGAIRPGPARGGEVDAMTARAYRHPVLDDRVVVRLVGATVGPAEDLSMEFLGFSPAAEPAEVGHARRQALGFPAWALVNDPANGRHALALVKSMERLARLARSKPGNAKDGYEELAARLGAAAPSFLPTFWEQAGRAFLAADNQRMAGTCFTQARRAEQVHALAIDEDRLRDVHLEFAFAGALTAAMLTEYAKGVVGRRPAAEAYELVKTLALQRVAGGLPPHATMAADLARLARTAGLDPEREAEEVAGRLLTYPAVTRSHPSLWKTYRKSLVRLAQRDPAVRARLLAIVPDPPGWRTDITDQWLELLEATGAAADLVAGAVPARRWLERFLAGRAGNSANETRSAPLLALVERLVPRLAGEGVLRISPYPWRVEMDVLDLCLAGGVPVDLEQDRSPYRRQSLNVLEWTRDDGPGRRDLAAVAADPVWRPMLVSGVRDALAAMRPSEGLAGAALPDGMLDRAFGSPGVRSVLVDLIEGWSQQAAAGAVAGLDVTLKALAPLWSPAGTALAPDAFRRFAEVDMAAVLARTLRAGLTAELGWPAFEAVAKQVKHLRIGMAWPELVIHDDRSAHVIQPDGTVTEHVFRYPPADHRLAPSTFSSTDCAYVDGDLLVRWRSDNGTAAYWSSRPDELLEGEWNMSGEDPLPLPGGGVTTGSAPVHAGDARGPEEIRPVATDGQAYWRREWDQDENGAWGFRWREFDPATGRGGRFSLPAFFAAAGDGLVADSATLRPAPAAWADSPLGRRDGLVGWRTTKAPDGTQTGESVDGRRATLAAGADDYLVGALLMPGATAPLPVTRARNYRQHQLRLWTADGSLLAEMGQVSSLLPSMEWWHALRPRDEAGSAALRAIDEKTAAALLEVDAASTDVAGVKQAVTANLAAHLPEVTDETLRARIAEVIARAVRLMRRVAEVPEHLAAGRGRGPALPDVTDEALQRAWNGLCARQRYYSYGGARTQRHELIAHVHRVGAALAGDTPESVPEVGGDWLGLLAGLGAVALRAASTVTGDDDRAALTGFLGVIAGTPLDGSGPPLRVVRIEQERMTSREVDVQRDGSQITVLLPMDHDYGNTSKTWRRPGVQVAPDGVFRLPAGATLQDESRPSGRLAGDRLRAFLTLLAERGPAPWRPAAADELATATGMTRAEAALLLAGLPGIQSWEANFLGTEQRKLLGLTPAGAKLARAALQSLPEAQRVALLDAAMPADPAGLWEHGPDVAGIAAEWIRVRGRRMAVPEELITELARVIDGRRAGAVLQALVAPRPGDWLSTDGRSEAAGYWRVATTAADGTPFDEEHLRAVAVALPWLAYHLRWDDPLRAALPDGLRLVRDRLRNPDLLVGNGTHRVDARPDAGPALVDGTGYHDHMTHHVAPARLAGADDPAIGFIDSESGGALRTLLSDWLPVVVATPPGVAGDPRDPRVSVPRLVAEVAERYRIPADAAAYYLQLLALPDPTDKLVQARNGWTAATLRAARAALLAAGLVVTAKRERAGRTVFLPGGWQPARSPMLPSETWKTSLFTLTGKVPAVTRPVPELFAAAWARVTAGDVPRYTELEEQS